MFISKLNNVIKFNMDFEVIILNTRIINNSYAAQLWNFYKKCEIIENYDDVENYVNAESNQTKNILIVDDINIVPASLIVTHCDYTTVVNRYINKINIFLNPDRKPINCFYHKSLDEETGFLTWTVEKLNIKEEHITLIAKYMDKHRYGYISNDCLYFMNGLMTKKDQLQTLLNIRSKEDIYQIIHIGKSIYASEYHLAKYIMSLAKEIPLQIGDKIYYSLTSISNTSAIEYSLFLAKNSRDGIGIIFKYNLLKSKTIIYISTTKKCEINTIMLRNVYFKGGYTKRKSLCCIVLDRLLFPEKVFKYSK